MKTLLKLGAGIVLVSVCSFSYAQQLRQTNLYEYNKYSFNPAYAGFSGCTEVNFSHLNQWVQITGAPVTNYLSMNTRLGKSFGVGGNILLDRAGMLQQFNSSLGASYGMTFAEEHVVRVGLSGGFFQLRVDPTDAIAFDNGDVILDGGIQSSAAFNTAAGLLYNFKGLELSVSSQQVIESRTNGNYPGIEGYGMKRHLNGFASYDVLINKKFTLIPSLFYKSIDATGQLDINADVNYNDFIFGGLGYRTQVGMLGRIGVNVRKFFFIAYSYELPMQNIAKYGNGSHEIALVLKFCKKDKEELPPVVEEVVPDTVRIVEQIVDTLIVERVDTVFIDNTPVVEDVDVQDALLQASQSLKFENDKAIILKESYGDLESLTNILLMRPDLNIRLEGHTDSDGTAEYNLNLSKNRVNAVKAFFVANGVDADRVETAYYGESKPIADNNTEEGQAKNRRVEMTIVK